MVQEALLAQQKLEYSTNPSELVEGFHQGFTEIALDTETNGLEWWNGKKPFCLVAYNGSKQFYFNFHPFHTQPVALGDIIPTLLELDSLGATFIFANAKFDMHMLGTKFTNVKDVLILARLLYNNEISYSLEKVGERLGFTKSDEVNKYIIKNKLYDKVAVGGTGKTKNVPRYDLVPFDVIAPYAINDVRITWEIYQKQKELLAKESQKPIPPLTSLIEQEHALIPVLMDMEKRGLKLDLDYCEKAAQYGREQIQKGVSEFEEISKYKYTSSNKELATIFSRLGVTLPKSEKNNDEVSESVLQDIKNKFKDNEQIVAMADKVLFVREHYKRTHTYFVPYTKICDDKGFIHSSFHQAGTKTGRMSMSEPNLQNISKRQDKEALYPVRNAIVHSKGTLLSIDYKAFEFCAALDYAGEYDLALAIQNGVDPHQATAELIKSDRSSAKTVAFGLLYGEGLNKLAGQLNCTVEQAKNIRNQYFAKLPRFYDLIQKVTNSAKERGYIFNKFGRRAYFPDPNYAYRAINSLIQGCTADAVKKAILLVDKKYPESLVLQVHDELVFDIDTDMLSEVKNIIELMIEAYPVKDNAYKMQCSASIGRRWGEMKEL